jgi:type IV pilus assembly protein PilB
MADMALNAQLAARAELPGGGPPCLVEVRTTDGQRARGRLAGSYRPGGAVGLFDETGQARNYAAGEIDTVQVLYPALGAASRAADLPEFELRLVDGSVQGGVLASLRTHALGLALEGEMNGRPALLYVPFRLVGGLDLKPPPGAHAAPSAPHMPDAPAAAGGAGLNSNGRVTVLRSVADLRLHLDVVASRKPAGALAHAQVDVAAARAAGVDEATQAMHGRALRFGLPLAEIQLIQPDSPVLSMVPASVARRLRVVPLVADANFLCVAVADPANTEVIGTLEFLASRRIVPVLASSAAIGSAVSQYYDRVEDEALVRSLGLHGGNDTDAELAAREVERLSTERPVVRLVADLIAEAVRRRASDIHLRPAADGLDLLYRIDGELLPVRHFVRPLLPALVSRIKVIGGMNIAERRVPQDGRTTVTEDGRLIDLRISVLPTVDGESVVIRLLNTADSLLSLDAIGFNPRDGQLIKDFLGRSHGLILVTGPTGCGKSTTLYAALVETRKQNVNIITVEDPVEFHIAGIEQVQVNRAAGVSFARVLRNILRHDPDVIMIGEIRDRETAEIGVESALTGHIVLSTLHTNNAASAITRLLDLGVESFLLRSTLMAVLAQRLARRNCRHCLVVEDADPHVREVMGVKLDEVFHRGAGCTQCDGTGVRGRAAVYELLPMSAGTRRLVVPNADAEALHDAAVAEGMVPITEHALALARAGVISLGEAFRIRVE